MLTEFALRLHILQIFLVLCKSNVCTRTYIDKYKVPGVQSDRILFEPEADGTVVCYVRFHHIRAKNFECHLDPPWASAGGIRASKSQIDAIKLVRTSRLAATSRAAERDAFMRLRDFVLAAEFFPPHLRPASGPMVRRRRDVDSESNATSLVNSMSPTNSTATLLGVKQQEVHLADITINNSIIFIPPTVTSEHVYIISLTALNFVFPFIVYRLFDGFAKRVFDPKYVKRVCTRRAVDVFSVDLESKATPSAAASSGAPGKSDTGRSAEATPTTEKKKKEAKRGRRMTEYTKALGGLLTTSSRILAALLVATTMLLTSTVMAVQYPWTFDNDLFGGPDFWGLLHGDWRMCTAGQMQSPVNIDPGQLLFDPHLVPIHVDAAIVEATFVNTGQLPMVTIRDTLQQPAINVTGGPGMPYRYKLHQISIHFGSSDEGEKGSEHTVDRVRFPAEIQLLAYNSDLYANFSVAMTNPRGLLAIAVIVDIGPQTSLELRRLTVASQSITYKGMEANITHFQPSALLPRTAQYVTYEGSLTYPGCHETVTWVIMNNPIYITKEDLQIWNELQKTEVKQAEPSYMTPAYRPLRSLNGRLLRTNINVGHKASLQESSSSTSTCPSNVYVEMGYRANPARTKRNDSSPKRSARRAFDGDVDEILHPDAISAASFEAF